MAKYSYEFKMKVVQKYLDGEVSPFFYNITLQEALTELLIKKLKFMVELYSFCKLKAKTKNGLFIINDFAFNY